MSDVALPERDSTLRPWLITIALILAVVFGYRAVQRYRFAPTSPFPAPSSEIKPVNWYLVLKMPPVTSQYESGIETMKARYGEWLDTLTKAGFRPAVFSDVDAMRRTGVGLPPKSVIVMFDPGLRRTYETISPIFERHRWPAVWMSDREAMFKRHREYITYHLARNMTKSGLWDVGVKQSNGTYRFDIAQNKKFSLGYKGQDAWSLTTGAVALNRGSELRNLNSLNVNSDWTPVDLLNRIMAETPVESPSYLTVGNVQNLVWGISRPVPMQANHVVPRFDLGVGKGRKSAALSWLGTEGVDNFRLYLDVPSFTGTVAFRFRWNEEAGNGVQVSVSKTALYIEERENFNGRMVARVARNGDGGFNLRMITVGDRIALALDGQTIENIPPLSNAGRHAGVSAIYIFDRINEVAHVSGVQAVFEPLPKNSVAWPPTL